MTRKSISRLQERTKRIIARVQLCIFRHIIGQSVWNWAKFAWAKSKECFGLQYIAPPSGQISSGQACAIREELKANRFLGIISIIWVIIGLHLVWFWRIPFCTVPNNFIANEMIHMSRFWTIWTRSGLHFIQFYQFSLSSHINWSFLSKNTVKYSKSHFRSDVFWFGSFFSFLAILLDFKRPEKINRNLKTRLKWETKVSFFYWAISATDFSGLGPGIDKRFFASCFKLSLVSRKNKDFFRKWSVSWWSADSFWYV